MGFDQNSQPLCDLLGFLHWDFRQQDAKLFAAVPCDNVFSTDHLSHQRRQIPENDIAGIMTIVVIDAFEFVDVEHDRYQRMVIAGGARLFLIEALEQVPPVVELSQFVGDCFGAESS